MALKLPRYVLPKSLAGGRQAFYYTVPTKYRKLGCTIPNEPLGDYVTACGADGEGGRAAVLNALFDEWFDKMMGKPSKETLGGARVGTVDWLFREYKRSKAYLEKVSKRSRPGYEHSMQAIGDFLNKKGERIGSLPIKSISPRAADLLYEKFITNDKDESVLYRRGEKFVGLCRKAWRVVHRLYPAEFAKDVPNPWPGVTMKTRVKASKPAVTREQVYTFANGAVERGEVGAAAAAVICFEWLQRPENVLAGHIRWTGYRANKSGTPVIQIEHHKTGAKIDHPLEDILDDGTAVQLYPEAEAVLAHLKRLGVPLILREVLPATDKRHVKPGAKAFAKPYSFSGMQKIVQRLRKDIGLPTHFTLDACRHGGMTELEEAELTEGQGRALSAHRTKESYAGYAKRTAPRVLAATRKRRAHVLANAPEKDAQNDQRIELQNDSRAAR
ncbi:MULTISPECIES: hypothetical protein [unclassified Bradyrhizobium]|uniref:hypothetical protein n=1 Tax=unclassified Bradyrhizobium TaxID=2631580 RepID=UPI0028EB76F6|nr:MULTISPECIES: hypothetical protein [unclassified Bradyrhizobium]